MRFTLILPMALLVFGCASNGKPSEDAQLLDKVPKIENQNHGKEDYVPQNLYDALSHLKKLLKPEQIQEMKQGTEQDMIQYHFGLGMWMRNNWGLWGNSKLRKWFISLGIHHPDDMSGIILNSLWRDLNDQPLHISKQVEFYNEFWKQRQGLYDVE